MASRKRIVICYILLQASFWGMLSSICAYQAAVVLDRGFTAGQAGIFCALCYFASLFTQPVIGGWADRLKTWANGSEPRDLPRIDPGHTPDTKPRDVYAFFITEGKVNAPNGARELQKRTV